MTYGKTWFNDTEVLTLTRNQFIKTGGRGNHLNEAQLAEVYDLIVKKKEREDSSKHVAGGASAERTNVSSGIPKSDAIKLPVKSEGTNVNRDNLEGGSDRKVQEPSVREEKE